MLIRCRNLNFLMVITILSLLYGSSHQNDKKPGFIATFPSSVIPESWAKFCISFQNIATNILFSIENNMSCFSKIEKNVDSREKTCFDVWIDENCKDKSESTISINGKSEDGSYRFNDSKYFSVKSTNFFRLIETDKPMYKPGDKLRLRVLTLDFQLRPLVKTFRELYVIDSSGSRISQWPDVKDLTGLIDLEMPISPEPNLGNWKVQLVENDGKSVKADFEVKKYVLPKFEVSIQHPTKIWAASIDLVVKICATYSHGNDVKGDFELKAYTKKFSYINYKEEIHKTQTYKKKAKGCVNFKVQLAKLDINKSSFIYSLYFDAKVTEDKTNIVMNKSSSSSVSFNNFDVNLIESNNYKPGFKTNFKLIVATAEGNGYSNEQLKCTFERNGQVFYDNNFVTDKDGILEFVYDPDTCTKCSSLGGIEKPESFYLKVIQSSDPNNYQTFPIAPWYTEKNSYVSIIKPLNYKNFQCDQNFKTEIIFKTDDSTKLSNKLHFHLQSRTNFTLIADYDLETNKFTVSSGENTINFKINLNDRKTVKTESNHKQKFDYNGRPTYEITELIFDLSFDLKSEMSPELNLLTYFTHDNEIIPDTLTIEIPKCLENKVLLDLGQSNVRPGRFLNFTLISQPNSLCALSAIDKSVSFMGTRNNVDTAKIFNALSKFEMSDWYLNSYESSKECQYKDVIGRKRGIYPFPHYGLQFYDPTKSFNQAKVIYLSDLKIYRNCRMFPPYAMSRSFSFPNVEAMQMPNAVQFDAAPIALESSKSSLTEDEQIISSIRQFFPETWLWNIESVGENGIVNKREKVPDTITDWLMDAYCLSNKAGLGIAETKVLKVFQPLFVSLNLPYSVIRGEVFPVFATVFNYDSTCIPTLVEITGDTGITFVNSKSEKLCVCPEDEITHQFNLKALDFSNEKGFKIYVKVKSLNDSTGICNPDTQKVTKNIRFWDSEIKSLIVEPEGIPKEQVKSSLFVFKDRGSKVSNQEINMTVPTNIISKSSRVYLRVTGDAIGSVLDNLESLVQQPTGCGEQNMVKFAPIVFVANYLKETDQLNSKIEKKIQEYLQIGYQRQLTYRHKDGSFSAFGPNNNNEGGGTWLTAFVLRCFSDSYASNHIKIDPKDIEMSLKMLTTTQDEDGSFKQVGAPLFSKALAGGLKDKKTGLSAYVIISMLKAIKALDKIDLAVEINLSLSKGLEYLSSSLKDVMAVDTYTLALAHYVFKLANLNDALISKIDYELNKRATKQGDLMYWKEKDGEKEELGYFSQSADLEITSYILTSRLYNTNNVAELVPIAKWINSNRNSLGGFYSTQDTVVALEALSKFASLSFSKNMNLRLDYTFNSHKQSYYINNFNRLTSYMKKMDNFKENESNKFTFDLTGYGTALVELIFKYNLVDENLLRDKNGFDFSITPVSTQKSVCSNVKLSVNAKKNGDEDSNSMVIVGLRLPTGWEPIEESIKSLENTHDLRRYELNENKISLYFDELTPKGKNFEIDALKKFDIKDIKPGQIYVYDYYEPLENAVTQQFEINVC